MFYLLLYNLVLAETQNSVALWMLVLWRLKRLFSFVIGLFPSAESALYYPLFVISDLSDDCLVLMAMLAS